jgi:hypothetical protein
MNVDAGARRCLALWLGRSKKGYPPGLPYINQGRFKTCPYVCTI